LKIIFGFKKGVELITIHGVRRLGRGRMEGEIRPRREGRRDPAQRGLQKKTN